MPLSADISTALHLLEHVHERVEDCDDPKLQMHTTQDLKSLISLLEDPVFRSIVTIQDSLIELNSQLGQHPSILPGDFDINISGQLELSVPSTPVQPLGPNMYTDLYQDSSELEDQRVPVAPLVHSSSEDTSAQVTSPSLVSEVIGMPPITTPTYAKEFNKVIEAAARGRQICTVQLFKPEGTSLGFSVVGLRNKDKGELGIFLQEIQPNGIAGCDGRLLEGDQILAIDGQPLDSNISHEQAISILQKARGLVELVVARSTQDVGSSLPTDEVSGGSTSTAAAGAAVIGGGAAGPSGPGGPGTVNHHQIGSDKDQSVSSVVTPAPIPKSSQPPSTTSAATPTPTQTPIPTPTSTPVPGGLVIERSPSAVSDASKSGSDMVLNTEWAQVEVINLINDGSGLGFGIIGGRSTGVVVKTILPGGVADRDNRLQSGDHILQIGDVNLRGMGSEQVAAVLRQSGTHVRLVVARPVEPTSPDYQALGSHAPIVPTKILGDPDELDRHLVHSVPETYNIRHVQGDTSYDNGYMYSQESDIEMHARPSLIMDVVRNPMPIGTMPVISAVPVPVQMPELPVLTMDTIDVNSLPEMERFTVELKKDIYGLGITIAGYVCEKEELSGIFVKSISEGSAADLSNKIQINDRIVEVDRHSLQGYSNHEAVEVLRSTGQTVTLCLERYLRGPKFEQLQQAIAASELRLPQPSSPSITSLPSFPMSADGETTTEIEPEGESHTTVDSAVLQEGDREKADDYLDEATNVEALLSDPSSELTPQIRAAIKSKWQKIVGPDTEIVVAQLKKFAEGSGLGISLEGTVDVENGQEVRPHHYIRSILPEGPVGQNGTLRSGDELLEVNGYRLLGINHMEVVSVLKELPIHVRMVCGRNIASQDPLCPIDTAQHQAAFQTRSILGGSLQNLLPTMDRLVKAKSDGSLASTTTTATVTDASLNKMKSRSLEPLTGLAMWSSEPQIIELVKGERGLGFSILDYQDPMNPNETVIVIRSLVPGGVAQVDGQLIPGDRLLFVNDIALENATLDQAVQALKGAAKGTVRIGVAKPLPIPDSIVQWVSPICKVRRSRSLPGGSETSDRAAEIEDFLSSRSGVTELPLDKSEVEVHKDKEQEQDEDEEEDHWKDASPLTPICSPTRKPSVPSRSQEEWITSEHEAAQAFYAASSAMVAEEAKVSANDEEESENAPEATTIFVTDNFSVARSTEEVTKSVESARPKVKLKRKKASRDEEEKEDRKFSKESTDLTCLPGEPQGSVQVHSERERKDTLRRHSRFESDGRVSLSKDTLERVDGSLGRGAIRKVYSEKDHGSGRRAKKEKSRKKADAVEVSEDSKKKVDWEDTVGSVRMVECMDRLTVVLEKADDSSSDAERISKDIQKRGHIEDEKPEVVSSSKRKKSPVVSGEVKVSPEEVDFLALAYSAEDRLVDETAEIFPDFVAPIIQRPPEVGEAPEKTSKRPSSLRKKRDSVSRESSRESLLEEGKKEVRIQDDVLEIFFEERVTAFQPEAQLVTARIITYEEAVASLLEEAATRIEVHPPPEVAVVSDLPKFISMARVPSPQTVEPAQLQLPSLAKSTSENTLVEADVLEQNRVSEKNIKPEILLDLSKVSDRTEDEVGTPDSGKEGKERRPLSRTGSEGSKRSGSGTPKVNTVDAKEFKVTSLALPGEPEYTILTDTTSGRRDSVGTGSEVTEKKEEKLKIDVGASLESLESHENRHEEAKKRVPTRDEALPEDTKLQRSSSEQHQRREEEKELAEESIGGKEKVESSSPRSELRDYESRRLRHQKRPLVVEEEEDDLALPITREEDSLISKEHSLEYQSQTLETQSDHLIGAENLFRPIPESWTREVFEESLEEVVELSFKETQYSPREKREVETQTEQETKSTQCSPEESIAEREVTAKVNDSCYYRDLYYRSPRREVQTQTQGESKSVQCSLEALSELAGISKGSVVDVSTDSPSRTERSSQVQESKSIQCVPEDISASPGKQYSESLTSPRREAEVQTYQESKGVQCNDEDLPALEYRSSRPPSSFSQKSEGTSPSSSSSSPRKFPTVVFVEGGSEMTVTHRDHDGSVAWAKHWGPERLVEIYREPKTSLGLSIVGGKVDLHNGSSSKSQNISGIFIKNVLPNSPAGRTGDLKVGDRIIEVDGVDLRHSTHERAVEVIQAAGNPVCLLVQSLVHLSPDQDGSGQEDDARGGRRPAGKSRALPSGVSPGTPTTSFRQKSGVSPARSITPEVIQAGAEDSERQSTSRSDFKRQSTRGSDGAGPSARRSSMKKSVRKKAPSPPSNPGILREVSEEREDNAAKPERPTRKYSSEESSDEEDTRELEGNVYTKAGMEISRRSAGNVKRTKEEIEADPEQEDEYGYTEMKVQKKYHNLGHPVIMVKIEKDRRGLGISLAGHKDRNRMAVFVCGLNPKGAAHKMGTLSIGDEILEVNGTVLQGRCHLNASALIKGMAGTCFRIIVVRRAAGVDNLAVKPIVQFPPSLEDGDQFSQYKGVRNVPVKKGQYGLGIMIIEGKHAEVGQGIFVSDIQEGSAAEQAGLLVGDMILAVNMDCLLGSTYDEATSLLKKAEGVVTLTVCNPNQSKIGTEDEEKGKGGVEEKPAAAKEPEKPKEPEPPQDPKDCKIQPGRDTTIEFQKEKDKGIGFTIAGGSDTPMNGVFILEVFPDGAAGKDGRLQSGDQILDMCNESFKAIEHEKAHAAVLKASGGTIVMVVHRSDKPPEEIEVELQKKAGKGAGLCITGFKSGKGAYVSDLLPAGSALESGKICKGDLVVAIGGQDVREAPVEDIAVHIKVSNPVQLKLARYKSAKQ